MINKNYYLMINNLIIFLFFISCTQKNSSNLLSRNENGYEIPRDILFNGEYVSANTPNYFQKLTIRILSDNKIIGSILSSNNKSKAGNEFVSCFSLKKPGIPFLIHSPDRAPNSDFNVSFKKDFSSSDCLNLNLFVNKSNKYIMVQLNDVLTRGKCEFEFIVSTPDNLNQISRNMVITWGENKNYLCDENFLKQKIIK